MRTHALLTLGALPLVLAGVSACSSGSAVDASCDVDGVTDEIEHILSEADGELGAIESIRCDEGWAYATVTVVEPTREVSESFLLRGTDMGWILSSTADACVEGGPISIPEALREVACVSDAAAAPSS